ncbi:alpha/beta hydrolase [Spiribacter halobius]|nr:alpha/beta hydrolase [Spiribacter halobius]UEX77640.1 alpha/beta hydrolase [Spiribacter halobius]
MIEWSLSHTYHSPEGRVRWERFGEGRPIILLHGTPNWSVIWRNIAPRLAERWAVYAFDWPGFGTSDRYPGQNVSWDEQPRRLVELVAHWGLERPAIVAFDFAPIFALRAQLLEGLELGPLVLADAAVIPPFVTDFSRQARENIGTFRQLPTHIAEGMIRAHIERTTRHPMPPEVIDAYMWPWSGQEGVAAYWRAVECYDEHLARPLVPRLAALSQPVMVLWGEHDEWLPPSMGETLTEAIRGARLRHVPEAGHFAQEDNPAGFAEAVAEFLEEVGYR